MTITQAVRPSWYQGQHRAATPWQQIWGAVAFVALIALCLTAIGVVVARPARADYSPPITAMFFYDQTFRHSTDHYLPALSPYSSDNPTHVAAQVAGMRYAGMQAAIASWWGQGQHGETTRFPVLYRAAAAQGLGVIPYYEPEGSGDPSVAQIQADLTYLGAYAAADPDAAVRIGGKPVIFVYNAGATGCAEVTKWKNATNGFTSWYVNMKVFPGYASCPDQPSSWHQYGPAVAESVHLPYSFNISPGFWHYQEATPRLARDPARWATNVAHLAATTAQWKLVTSWNEWGEATSVEPSPTWQSGSGYGTYVDELHRQLVGGGAPAPSPTGTASPGPSPSSPPSPTATTSPTASPSPTSSPTPPPSGDTITVMAAGDIVDTPPCNGYTSGCQDGWTAALLTRYTPNAALTLGDNQYESNTLAEYQAGWGRTACAGAGQCEAWGRHLSNIYPAPGNHEWLSANAQGYRDYFGARLAAIGSDTPSPSRMYYSYDLGAWHFVSLDSDCSKVGGCSPSSPQGQWLAADLAANDGRPTILYFHHPRWSSGNHGNVISSDPFWRAAVADLDVQLVLNGHDHWLEGFEPLGVDGLPAANGVREFVVGTGGKGFTCGTTIRPGSQAHQCTSMGTLLLTLNASSYSWSFKPVAEVGGPGPSFAYSGSAGLRLPPALAGVVAQTSIALTSLGVSIDTAARSVPRYYYEGRKSSDGQMRERGDVHLRMQSVWRCAAEHEVPLR